MSVLNNNFMRGCLHGFGSDNMGLRALGLTIFTCLACLFFGFWVIEKLWCLWQRHKEKQRKNRVISESMMSAVDETAD